MDYLGHVMLLRLQVLHGLYELLPLALSLCFNLAQLLPVSQYTVQWADRLHLLRSMLTADSLDACKAWQCSNSMLKKNAAP